MSFDSWKTCAKCRCRRRSDKLVATDGGGFDRLQCKDESLCAKSSGVFNEIAQHQRLSKVARRKLGRAR